VGANADAAVVHRDGLVDLDQRTGIDPKGMGRTGNCTKEREVADHQRSSSGIWRRGGRGCVLTTTIRGIRLVVNPEKLQNIPRISREEDQDVSR
jgi:hypothetical protein